MSNLTPTAQRARVVTDAVVSAYINEIAVPARRVERAGVRHTTAPARRSIARRPVHARRLALQLGARRTSTAAG